MSGMCACMKEGDHRCHDRYRPCCAGLTCSKRRECVSLGDAPSASPSELPSTLPSTLPSMFPSASPTEMPSATPSAEPTSLPSESASPSTPPCGGPCEDGDLCTINTCDIITNTCQTENVQCQEGEACDQFTGICQDVQNVVPCVAVIDEWDGRNYAAEWADFRSQYPQRPFCLLIPNTEVILTYLPTGFDDDTVNNPDGIDRTIATLVNRDNGNVDLASDWFNACGLDLLSPASITFIGLFIDTSGSMTLGTVRASYDKFLVDIQAAGIAFDQVFNGLERWIDPFFTILSPPSPSPTFMPSGVALPTISPSTSVPMPMGSASPTMSPSIAPSTNLPSQSPSMAASDAPSIAPSNQPILEPPQEALTLALSTGAITAGDSISIFPSLIKTTDGVPIDPLPAIVYQVTFVTGEASGTVPTVSSQAGIVLVETSDDTRGVYTLAATVDGTTTTTTEIFLVLSPSSSSNSTRGTMSLIYNKLSTSVNGVVQTVDALAEAADKNDTDAIETALVALRAFRDDIVLDEIRQTTICAPEEGFLPTPSQLVASGYPATSDDTSLQMVVEGLVKNIMDYSDALDQQVDVGILGQLDNEADVLIDQFRTLTPTVHGWVLAAEDMNYLYAIVFPEFVHSLVNGLEAVILREGIIVGNNGGRRVKESIIGTVSDGSSLSSVGGHRRTFGIASLSGALIASNIRTKIINKVYVPFLVDLYRSFAVLALGNLLQSYSNQLSVPGIITGASLSFHVFNRFNSRLEVQGANSKYPQRTDVNLIGTSAIVTAEEFIKAFDPRGIENLEDLYDYYQGLLDAIKSVADAASLANQPADEVLPGECILGGGSCSVLLFESGFEPVNADCQGFFCVPSPVLFLVRNLDTGGFNQGIFNFVPP